jgi:hypothetical protein
VINEREFTIKASQIADSTALSPASILRRGSSSGSVDFAIILYSFHERLVHRSPTCYKLDR